MLELKNSEGETMVRFYESDDVRIPVLQESARRHALKIDEALAGLLKEIDRPKN